MGTTYIVTGHLVTERELRELARAAFADCACGHSRRRHRAEGPCRHAGCRCQAYQPTGGK